MAPLSTTRSRWGLYTSVTLGFMAWSAVSSYESVWLSAQLRFSATALAVTFVLTSAAGVAGGVAGAVVVGRLGPRRSVIGTASAQALTAYWVFRPHEVPIYAAGALILITGLQPIRGVAQRRSVAAMTDDGSREAAFVAFRTAMNIGLVAGPLLISLFLLGGWPFARVGAISAFACAAIAGVGLPREAPAGRPGAATRPGTRRWAIVRSPLAGLLMTSVGAWMLVSGIELVVPATLAADHKISVATWGTAYAIASALVAATQLPIGRRMIRFSLGARLAIGTLALGVAVVLGLSTLPGPAALIAALALLSLGELLWGPPSEDLTLRVAPDGQETTYIAAVSTSIWIGEAVASSAGFLLLAHVGAAGTASAFGLIAVCSAAGYIALARRD